MGEDCRQVEFGVFLGFSGFFRVFWVNRGEPRGIAVGRGGSSAVGIIHRSEHGGTRWGAVNAVDAVEHGGETFTAVDNGGKGEPRWSSR